MPHLLLLLLAALAWAQGAVAMDRAAFVGLSASVLRIEVLRAQGGYALGSGVVVDVDKVVTNCHVTREAQEIHVLRGAARWLVESQAGDVDLDLCVLNVPGIEARAVTLGRASDLLPGQPVTALGYTGGAGIQSSAGDVVALHRHAGGNVIQSSNRFGSGASGGGLFDDESHLVGILTFRLRGAEAHYFAAPVEWLRRLLDDRGRYRQVAPFDAALVAYWQRPVETQTNFLRAAVLERDAKWAELESLALGWSRSDADDPEPWYLQGLALGQLGQFDQLPAARLALERAVALQPASSAAWFRLGLLYTRLGLLDDARRAHARLEALKPELAVELGRAIGKA